MTTLIRILVLENDIIEIHYNRILKNKPYLVRVFNYTNNSPVELRLDKKEINYLYKVLKENDLL